MSKVKLYVDELMVFSTEFGEFTPGTVKFSPCFQLSEFFTGCTQYERNNMPQKYYNNILQLCQMLTTIRTHFACAVVINSCYRDTSHNKRVGGVSTSEHLSGSAVDFTLPTVPIGVVAQYIKSYLNFGQCIVYTSRNFIHLSLYSDKHDNEYIIKE